MHLTEEELNEYLDNEIQDRTPIESHLSSCVECAARLATFKALFAEIESLPELELTRSIAARFAPSPGLPAQLPRWLTLTAILQAALALVAIILAAPVVMDLFPAIPCPATHSLVGVPARYAQHNGYNGQHVSGKARRNQPHLLWPHHDKLPVSCGPGALHLM